MGLASISLSSALPRRARSALRNAVPSFAETLLFGVH
jgi:hypothetical protein